jgi:hypothetical protein
MVTGLFPECPYLNTVTWRKGLQATPIYLSRRWFNKRKLLGRNLRPRSKEAQCQVPKFLELRSGVSAR